MGNTKSHIFVAGGTGYIGSRFVEAASKTNHTLSVLTRNQSNAESLKKKGVDVVIGDLTEPGPWQEKAAAADMAIYIAAPPTWGKKVTKKVARNFRDGMVEMTQSFFQSLDRSRIQKIVYVAGTSYYGDTGDKLATEELTPVPKGWGPYLTAVDDVEDLINEGYPAILAFPGAVYGPESWFHQLILEPLHNGKPIYGLKGYNSYVSPIHVEDCARALLHVLLHGKAGDKYILADNQPVTFTTLIERSSEITGLNYKKRLLPAWLCRIMIGPVLTEYSTADQKFSNQKLKNLDFGFHYPTINEGLKPVIEQWRNIQNMKH
jgi:nucleoside-diphosphate-sugar epimerase